MVYTLLFFLLKMQFVS